MNTPEDFWARVDKNGPISPKLGTHCWIWTGGLVSHRPLHDYGRLGYRGKRWYAHRLAFYLTYGEIPEGKDVCHKCDNTQCCNPEHLWADDAGGNIRDMWSKGRGIARHGSEHPKSKLTEAQVAEIRERYAAGERNKSALAREFGVSEPAIYFIISGRNRKYG